MVDLVCTKLLSKFEHLCTAFPKYDYAVKIAEGVSALMQDDAWLALPIQVRRKLGADPLAKGLHAYFASNKQVFAMWPDTLKGLMGRESMQNSKWVLALERALAQISSYYCLARVWIDENRTASWQSGGAEKAIFRIG